MMQNLEESSEGTIVTTVNPDFELRIIMNHMTHAETVLGYAIVFKTARDRKAFLNLRKEIK